MRSRLPSGGPSWRARTADRPGATPRSVVWLRWPVLGLVGLMTWLALALLPGVAGAGGGLSGILSTSGPAIRAQVESVTRFGLPVLTRVAVVQRDPAGLEPGTVARAVGRAVDVSRATLTGDPTADPDTLAAFPLLNTPLLVPNAAESNTTIVTYCSPIRRPICSRRTAPATDSWAGSSPGRAGWCGRRDPRADRAGHGDRARAARGRGGDAGHDRADRRPELPLRRGPARSPCSPPPPATCSLIGPSGGLAGALGVAAPASWSRSWSL